MKVLVTGAQGFIGSRVVRMLRERGHAVHAAGRADADLCDAAAAAGLAERVRPEALIHLAWTAAPGAFWSSPSNASWVSASTMLVSAALHAGCSVIVGAGSGAEYRWDGTRCVEDETPLSESSLYAAAKNAFRASASVLARAAGARFAWGRIFYPYGSGEPPEKFVSTVARHVSRGEPVDLHEPRRRLDYLHADDVARAFVVLAEAHDAAGTFNVASGTAVGMRDLAGLVARAAGADPALIRADENRPPGPDVVASVARINGLGWTATTTLEEGVAETVRGTLSVRCS